jgi:hypothetical protein
MTGRAYKNKFSFSIFIWFEGNMESIFVIAAGTVRKGTRLICVPGFIVHVTSPKAGLYDDTL